MREIMLRFRFAIILAVVALGAFSVPYAAAQDGNGQGSAASAPLLQITQPPAGAKLAQTFVSVQYQLTNPTIAQAGSPNFKVQLDSQDAITTTSTSQDFTGLAPGPHSVTVQLVDANGSPVSGAGASVKFTIVNPAPQSAFSGRVLPSGSSPLPLLSVIGFGVLLGGLVSAMRTR
jgi:hypothetical protein